jgi:hypothetical protein
VFVARQLGEQSEHDAGRWISLSVGQDGFDSLGMPVKGNTMILERLDKFMSDALALRNARDFTHEHLSDLAGCRQFLDSPQTCSYIIASLTGKFFLADFDDHVTLALGVLLQLIDLTSRLLLQGGDPDKNRDRD